MLPDPYLSRPAVVVEPVDMRYAAMLFHRIHEPPSVICADGVGLAKSLIQYDAQMTEFERRFELIMPRGSDAPQA